MDAVSVPPPMESSCEKPATDVIDDHSTCQTVQVKWLCISEIYEKFHRPNTFTVGGTYVDNVPDFSFTCKTENIRGIYLLHVFAGNHEEGQYNVCLSTQSLLDSDKDGIVRFTGGMESYTFRCKLNNQSYLTTYSFKSIDVEDILNGKKLYIAIHLTCDCFDKKHIETVMMNHDHMALLEDPVGSDFTIESEDGVEFPVHRHVITQHSEVFKAMLTEDMAESRTGRVKLVDVFSEDLKIMLEYIYSSTIKDIGNINFANIIMLADRFNLIGLRKLCDSILIDQMGPDTALDILVIADRFDCSLLKNEALKYIKCNKKLFKGSMFNEIDNLPLMKELCSVLMS